MIMTNGTTLYLMTEAEREREKAVADMSKATQGAKDWAEAFLMLHNAGYRKFEIVEGEE